MALAFIPQPKQVLERGRRFVVPGARSIGVSGHELYPVAAEISRFLGRCAVAVTVKGVPDTVTIRIREGLRRGGYRLDIRPTGILIEADSVAAAFHGAQTLEQTATQSARGTLPTLRINDWPDFAHRGVYYDVCRGRVPRLESLMRQVDMLAHYKVNQFQLYIEHTFRFRGHPDIGKGASPLTAEDILELDAHCRERHIELVPSLASFGHLATVLKHPQYHRLAEDWGIKKYVSEEAGPIPGWLEPGWSLSPANPQTYAFLDSLFAEFLPLFRSDKFNVCCDETWDLGLGQSHELCKKKGKGPVYLDHILKLRKLAKKYGKKIMFWGDIIRHYPELIERIPKDVTVLDWGYNHDHPFAAIKDFKKAGLEFYACPGTNGWVSLFPRLPEAQANIAGYAATGKRCGAAGLLNTDWGDGGHYNFMEYSWHGYLFGAEQAWNVKADQSDFTRRFCKLFLRIDEKKLADAIDELGQIAETRIDGFYQSVWQHIFFACPSDAVFRCGGGHGVVWEHDAIVDKDVTLDAALARRTAKRLERIRNVLDTHAKRRQADPMRVLPYWLFATDTMLHAARKLAAFAPGGNDTPAARRALKQEMRTLMRRFERLWMARNRRSEIRITLARYKKAIGSL